MNDSSAIPQGPLPENDWNFDAVPANEIIACCVWEYARESQTLYAGMASTLRRQGKSIVIETTRAARASRRRLLDLPSDQRAPLHSVLTAFNGRPWLTLAPPDRSLCAQLFPREVTPLRPASLEEAQALLAANRTISKEAIEKLQSLGALPARPTRQAIKRGPIHAVEPLPLAGLFEPPSPPGDWRAGCSAIALTVDFAHYNDHELATAFERLLGQMRPRRLAQPKRDRLFTRAKGNQLNRWRVAVERLAVARLVGHYGTDPAKFPALAIKLHQGRIYDRRERELRLADQFFCKLFPSLKGERMRCRRCSPAA